MAKQAPLKWQQSSPAHEVSHRNSLVRTLLVILLLSSLFPVLLIGTLTFFRSRELLHDQASRQVENVVKKEVDQFRQFIDIRESLMDQMATDQSFNTNLNTLVNDPPNSPEFLTARSLIFYYNYRANAQSANNDFFDNMFIIRPDGEVLISTNEQWIVENFGEHKVQSPFILDLIGTNGSTISYAPTASYGNQLVVFTTRSFVNENGDLAATIIATSTSPTLSQMLSDSSAFFQSATSFFFLPDQSLISTTADQKFTPLSPTQSTLGYLNLLMKGPNRQALFTGTNQSSETAMMFARWLPEYRIGMLLAVPEDSIYGQIRIADSFNLALLGISLLLTGSLIYFGSTQLVNPLVHLANTADRFSKGNWTERAQIKRRDEIGMLAQSFNHMADDLSQLYASLEAAVEKRTSQLRTASEVAQLATSTTQLQETLTRTAQLVAERFGFYHVAIFLRSESGNTMVLNEASGTASSAVKERGEHHNIGSDSLVGWVAANNKARVVVLTKDTNYSVDPLLPISKSEVAVPISSSDEVLGVLSIQSTQAEAFDSETVSMLQTLANQLSSTLQNRRLLETTQMSYQETSLLYRTTRQVTQARSENEILRIFEESFLQLPYITMVFNVQESKFKIVTVIDYRTGQIERNLKDITIPINDMVNPLTENHIHLIDLGQASAFDSIISFLIRRGCKSTALLSVVENGQLTRVIALGTHEENRFTSTSIQPYANLSEVIGAALEKFHVLGTLQQHLSELQILANVGQAVSAETNLEQLYHVLHQQVIQTLGPDINFAVALYNKEQNLIEIPFRYENTQYSPAIEPFPLGEGLTSKVIEERKPLLITQNTLETARALGAKFVGEPAKSWLGIPLLFGGEVVGALILQDVVNEEQFSENDLNLFMTLAPQIATAIRNAQLITEIQAALQAYDQEHFLLNTLLNHAPDGISFKDTEGRYIRASQSTAEFYYLPVKDLIGKTDLELAGEQMGQEMWNHQQHILESGQAQTTIFSQEDEQARTRKWWQVTGIPINDFEGKLYGLMVIQQNITELKETEQLSNRRAEELMTAAEIARDTTGTLDVESLLEKSVNLVRERFGFYHASIFLLDKVGDYAELRESTGEAGAQMMKAGHRLAVGSKSIVGQVTEQGTALVVNRVKEDSNYYPNPLLPETQSELAIPMKVGERILGSLDVQSRHEDAFNPDDVSVLQILADQVAVAVVNSELFGQTQELLGKHRLLRQITNAAGMSTNLEEALVSVVKVLRTEGVGDRIAVLLLNDDHTLQVRASAGYEGTHHLELRLKIGEGITGCAAAEKHPINVNDIQADSRYIALDPVVRSELAIPILFREELIGVLNLESLRVWAFDESDVEIFSELGYSLGSIMSNIRLVQQVRQQVERERLLFEVTNKIRHSVDLETIMQSTTREICQALGARRASIQITAGREAITERLAESDGHKNGQEAAE